MAFTNSAKIGEAHVRRLRPHVTQDLLVLCHRRMVPLLILNRPPLRSNTFIHPKATVGESPPLDGECVSAAFPASRRSADPRLAIGRVRAG